MRAREEFPRNKGDWNSVILYGTLMQKQLEGKGREETAVWRPLCSALNRRHPGAWESC